MELKAFFLNMKIAGLAGQKGDSILVLVVSIGNGIVKFSQHQQCAANTLFN